MPKINQNQTFPNPLPTRPRSRLFLSRRSNQTVKPILKLGIFKGQDGMTIALTADHAGYEQCRQLQTWLESLGYECQNFGPPSFQPNDDYPDFVKPAAKAVASGQCQ